MASIVLSTPGWETLNCSAIAIIAAPTMSTSTQERWYSPQCTKVALGSAKTNFPAMNRSRIYKKPGVYLNAPLLGTPRRYAAVAELAIGPSALLTSVLAIDFPLSPGSGARFQRGPHMLFRGGSYHTSTTMRPSHDNPIGISRQASFRPDPG